MEIITLKKYPDDWLIVLDARQDFAAAAREARAQLVREEVQAVVLKRASATLDESRQIITATMDAHDETTNRLFTKYDDGSFGPTDANGKAMPFLRSDEFENFYGPDLSQSFNIFGKTFPEFQNLDLRKKTDLLKFHIDRNNTPRAPEGLNLEPLRGGIFAVESICGGGTILIRSCRDDFTRSGNLPVWVLPESFDGEGRPQHCVANGDIVVAKGRHWENPCIHSAMYTYGRIVAVYNHR
jgi:hypothetical protein